MPPLLGAVERCKNEACRIQDCLAVNDYEQIRCIRQIKALVLCCREAEAQGEKPVQCAFSPKAYSKMLEGIAEEHR
jgi:hypothetical protein